MHDFSSTLIALENGLYAFLINISLWGVASCTILFTAVQFYRSNQSRKSAEVIEKSETLKSRILTSEMNVNNKLKLAWINELEKVIEATPPTFNWVASASIVMLLVYCLFTMILAMSALYSWDQALWLSSHFLVHSFTFLTLLVLWLLGSATRAERMVSTMIRKFEETKETAEGFDV